VEVLVSSRSTQNAFCVVVETCKPGGGPPPHFHVREDELFRVLEGDFEMFDGQRWEPFVPGEIKFKARGQVHAFRNCGVSVGQMMAILSPGGIDNFFEAISAIDLPEEIERLIEVSNMFGITFAPPNPSQVDLDRLNELSRSYRNQNTIP